MAGLMRGRQFSSLPTITTPSTKTRSQGTGRVNVGTKPAYGAATVVPRQVLTAFAATALRGHQGVIATPWGVLPTATVAVTVFDATSITDTLLESWFTT